MTRLSLVAGFLAATAALAVAADAPKSLPAATPQAQPQEQAQPAAAAPEVKPVSLTNDLMPLFQRSCGVCHKRDGKGEAVENKVYYETKEDLLGKIGKAIVPGKPEESGLVKVCNQTKKFGGRQIVMPPPKSKVPKFEAAELALLEKWIAEGAKDN